MAKITGVGGSVSIGATAYCVEQWSLTLSNEIQEVTGTCDGGWVRRIAGYSSGSATFSIFVDGSTAAATIGAFAPGTTVALTLAVGGSGVDYSGNFIVSSAATSNPAKSPIKFDVSAESDGAITYS